MHGARIEERELGLTWIDGDAMRRASHALVAEGRVWIVDPFEDPPSRTSRASASRPRSCS